MDDKWGKPHIERFCGNCGKRIFGYQADDGLIRIQCPGCGMVSVVKKISRRHVRVEEHAINGNYFK